VLKKALMKNRCIIPADSFYAWKKIGKKSAVPYRIISDQELFSFAGIWEEFEDEDGSMLHTFTLITTAANARIAPVHERMPVILDAKSEAIWLDETSDERMLIAQLTTYPAEKINLYTVAPRISDVRLDVPSLILPAPAADQHGNLTLFD
jgi:putative SOS response-associated peptidase YedK